MGWLRGELAIVFLILASPGCLFGSAGTQGTSATGTGDGWHPATGAAGATGADGGDKFCGQVSFKAVQPIPPDILIVQDRSLSMNDDSNGESCTGGCGASSKWSLMSAALENVVMATQTTVAWGLELYGDDDTCGVNPGATVGIALNNYAAIQAALAGATPAGDAPTETAINSAVATLRAQTDGSPKYLLLATDGLASCPPGGESATADDAAGAETAVANAAVAGFPTFVVGIAGASDAVATATLNQMAKNGNEPQVGAATSYYTIADIAALKLALNPGISQLSACTIALPHPVGDMFLVAVTTATALLLVPQDPANGWSFLDASMSSIALNGASCLGLMDGTYSEITLFYGCGGPVGPLI